MAEEKMTKVEYNRRNKNIFLGTLGGMVLSGSLGLGLLFTHGMRAPKMPQGYEQYASRRESVSMLEEARNKLQNSIFPTMTEYESGLYESLNNVNEIISLQRQNVERIYFGNTEFQTYERETERHNNAIYGLGYESLTVAGMLSSFFLGKRKQKKLEEEYRR